MPDIFLYQGETSPNDIKLRDPTIAAGGTQTLTPSLFVDGDTFYVPTVTPGTVTLTPSLFVDGDTFYSATVTLGAAPQAGYQDPGGIPDPHGGKFWRDKWKKQREGEKPPVSVVAQLPAEIVEIAAKAAPIVVQSLPDEEDEDAIEALLKVLELI